MSKVELTDAIAKLETLSDARAKRIMSLIEDLTELEALENAADLKATRDALGESEETSTVGAGESQAGCANSVFLSRQAKLRNFSPAYETRSCAGDRTGSSF